MFTINITRKLAVAIRAGESAQTAKYTLPLEESTADQREFFARRADRGLSNACEIWLESPDGTLTREAALAALDAQVAAGAQEHATNAARIAAEKQAQTERDAARDAAMTALAFDGAEGMPNIYHHGTLDWALSVYVLRQHPAYPQWVAECQRRNAVAAAVKLEQEKVAAAEAKKTDDALADYVRANGSDLARARMAAGHESWRKTARRDALRAAILSALGLTDAWVGEWIGTGDTVGEDAPGERVCRWAAAINAAAKKLPADAPVRDFTVRITVLSEDDRTATLDITATVYGETYCDTALVIGSVSEDIDALVKLPEPEPATAE